MANMFGNAEAYNQFMGRWSRIAAPLFVDFCNLPDQEGHILDVGSGTGALTAALARRHPRVRVVGIDSSREYVAHANHANPFPERASFQFGDAQQLDFPVASFHACLSLLVFSLIPDARKAVRELCRVTRPGGPIAAAVWDYGGGMQMLHAFWDAAISLDPGAAKVHEGYLPFCRAGYLLNLWQQAGLEDVIEQPIEFTMCFQSFADYWDPFLLGQGPAGTYVASLDQDRLKVLHDALKRRLSATEEASPLDLPARMWAVRGTVPRTA